MKRARICLELSDALLRVIDTARGRVPRVAFVEEQLWKTKAVQQVAKELGLHNPRRPADMRGGDRRSELYRALEGEC